MGWALALLFIVLRRRKIVRRLKRRAKKCNKRRKEREGNRWWRSLRRKSQFLPLLNELRDASRHQKSRAPISRKDSCFITAQMVTCGCRLSKGKREATHQTSSARTEPTTKMTAANVFTQLHSKKYSLVYAAVGSVWPRGEVALDRPAPNHAANDERVLDAEAEGV
jgi:hypothetical protein